MTGRAPSGQATQASPGAATASPPSGECPSRGVTLEEKLVPKFARVLAEMHGLREGATEETLKPWLRDARCASAYFCGYFEHIIEQHDADIGRLREMLSSALAGSGGHRSDCAVHNAPAYDPGPCDCGAQVPA